jgi:hypothetical protein
LRTPAGRLRISPLSNGPPGLLKPRFAIASAGLAAVIIYGSLYPFDFYRADFPAGPLRALLSTWPERTSFGDLLANILLYLRSASAPSRASARGHGYVWIPFYGFMAGEPTIAVPSFFEKAFNYGALLWLLGRGGGSSRAATAIGSTLVMAISFVHIYMPQRTAEVTDLVLLLSMAVVAQLTGSAKRPGWNPTC